MVASFINADASQLFMGLVTESPQWPPAPRELREQLQQAIDVETGVVKNFMIFAQSIEGAQIYLQDVWDVLPEEQKQMLVSQTQAMLVATSVSKERSFTRQLRILLSPKLIARPGRYWRIWKTLQHLFSSSEDSKVTLETLGAALISFARSVQRLKSREELRKELAQYPDWDRQTQIERNRPAMEWILKSIERDKSMTEEEIQAAQEDWKLFEQIIDENRPPGRKLFSEE